MANDAVIKARVESSLKDTVETIFEKLGLSSTEAITLFYRQVELRRGLPFVVELPNEETIKTLQDTDKGNQNEFIKKAVSLEELDVLVEEYAQKLV